MITPVKMASRDANALTEWPAEKNRLDTRRFQPRLPPPFLFCGLPALLRAQLLPSGRSYTALPRDRKLFDRMTLAEELRQKAYTLGVSRRAPVKKSRKA
jgi:hypothetical protein